MTLDQVMQDWAKDDAPEVKPVLSRRRWGKVSKWQMHLQEILGNPLESRYKSNLDERVEWTYQTLRTWNTAHRTAWDMWLFDTKHEAEKFITLYHLTWA